jgi:hypothetical protein
VTRPGRRVDADALAEVLEDGFWVRDPSECSRAAVARGVEAGLVDARWWRAFPCVADDPADDVDPEAPADRSCPAWVALPEGWVERVPGEDAPDEAWDTWSAQPDTLDCPGCGRQHRVGRFPRPACDAVRTRLLDEGVRLFMAAQLEALDRDTRPLRQGVGWRSVLGDDEVAVVWLDRSLEGRTTTRSFGAAQPTVYVTHAPGRWSARFRDEPNVVVLGLADWVASGAPALLDAVARTCRQPLLVSEPGLRPWARIRSPGPRVVPQPLGGRLLVVEPARATVDGVEVIGRDGRGVLALLGFLVDRWREDVADGKAPADHCVWTPEDIVSGMRDTGSATTASPATVRRQISRLRSGITRRYLDATGVRLDEDAVVENVVGQGYRVHPGAVVARRG